MKDTAIRKILYNEVQESLKNQIKIILFGKTFKKITHGNFVGNILGVIIESANKL